jgi:DNA-binding GntR family transcriptional regulator
MTRDDIIRMARGAGFKFNSLGGTYTSGKLDEHLERFAALVAAAEREACAKVCEKHCDDNGQHCANAIRAMGDK